MSEFLKYNGVRQFFKYKKNCPFCDSRVEISYASYHDDVFGTIGVNCPVCGNFVITTIDRDTEPRLDAYFDVWQNRPSDDEDDHK